MNTVYLNRTSSIRADCNQASGSYTTDGTEESGSISIELGPVTLAECGPDSLYQEFLQDLGAAAIYFFNEGDLMFDLKFDSGTMRLAPAGGA